MLSEAERAPYSRISKYIQATDNKAGRKKAPLVVTRRSFGMIKPRSSRLNWRFFSHNRNHSSSVNRPWKNSPQSIGQSRGGWTTHIHRVAVGHDRALAFSFSPEQASDAPAGRKRLKTLENGGWDGTKVIMDKAYEGDETRQFVFDLGREAVAPPKSNRLSIWAYDRELYTKRHDVERLFRRLKVFAE